MGMPFFTYFFKHVLVKTDGMPAIELIGILYFLMPYIALIAGMAAGIIADKLRLGRHIITICCFGTALFALLIGQSAEQWTAHWNLFARCLFIFPLMLSYTFFMHPISPVIDAETMLFLNQYNKREEYGIYRLWGTFGWSVATIAMGWLLVFFKKLSIIFYGTAAGYIVLGLVCISGIHAKPRTEPIKIPWRHLKKDAMFQRFLIFMFIYGIVSSATFYYLGYFFDDVMKTPLEMGIIFGTWTILEIPVMIFSHRIIKTFGNRWLIIVGLILSSVRLLLFSLFTLETPFIAKFGAALIHGPAFGMVYVGIIDLTDRQAHHNMRATYMSLMNVAQFSIAASFGGLLGSWIIKQWSGAFLMRFSGYAVAGLAIFFIFFVRGHGPVRDDSAKPCISALSN